MIQLAIVRVGDALGVRLPGEVLHRLHVGDGDVLLLTEAPDGGYRLSEAGLRQYRNTLRELAK